MAVRNFPYRKEKIFIWGKTYPELSNVYAETVCTGGVLEDGRPIRIYPIPYRYLSGDIQFQRYQWITARIAEDSRDSRPESYRIDCNSIELGDVVPTSSKYGWAARWDVISRDKSWHFSSVEDLQEEQKRTGRSIGLVRPKEVLNIEIVNRPLEDAVNFEEKLNLLRRRSQIDALSLQLFEETLPHEMRRLDFMQSRIQVHWKCGGERCMGHKMQIIDWEVAQLQRKVGSDNALLSVWDYCDPDFADTRFFLGNIRQHPNRFMIVGLWYPRAKKQLSMDF